MECAKAPSAVRKVKKKQVKDELDRIKQAEKKKRRLEKALATSAAIRSELEKKKQKKKEEQQRLDEQCASIAEAVALNVLLGEDSDNSCRVMLNKNEGFNTWDCASNFDLYMGGRKAWFPHQDFSKYSLGEIGWVYDAHRSQYKWNNWGNRVVSADPYDRDLYTPYLDGGGWEARGISAGLIAAQAVSSLHIGEDARLDELVFN